MSPTGGASQKTGKEVPKGQLPEHRAGERRIESRSGRADMVYPMQKPITDNKAASPLVENKKIIIGGKSNFLEVTSITFVYKKCGVSILGLFTFWKAAHTSTSNVNRPSDFISCSGLSF